MRDLVVRQDNYGAEDHSWVGSEHGFDNGGRPGELDLSLFVEGTHFPDGFIPSGTPLGLVTATQQYGPYGASPNEVQTLVIDATGGTITMSFDGDALPAYTYTNTAADSAGILATLLDHPNLAPGDVTVTQAATVGTSTTFTITFRGDRAGENVLEITNTDSLTGGAGTAVNDTVTEGGGAVSDGREVGAGFLAHSVTVSSDNVAGVAPCSVFWHGIVVEAKLPIAVDDAFKDDVRGFIRFE